MRKVIIKLTSTKQIEFRLPATKQFFSDPFHTLYRLITWVEKIGIALFVLFIFSSQYFVIEDLHINSSDWIIYFGLIIGALNLIKAIVSKGVDFPSVTGDLLILVTTTFISTSYLISTFTQSYSGSPLDNFEAGTISPLLIIFLWITYYLLIINNSQSNKVSVVKSCFLIAPIIGFLLYQINPDSQAFIGDVLYATLPGLMVLVFLEIKNCWIYGLLFTIALVIFWQNPEDGVLLSIIITAFVLLSTLFIVDNKNIKLIRSRFNSEIDSLIERKITISTFIKTNSEFFLVILCFFITVFGIIWFRLNGFKEIFQIFDNGIYALTHDRGFVEWIFGGSQGNIESSIFMQLLYSFGGVMFIAFISVIFLSLKNAIQIFLKKNNHSGFSLFLFSNIIFSLSSLLLFKQSILLLIFLFINIALVDILSNISVLNQKEIFKYVSRIVVIGKTKFNSRNSSIIKAFCIAGVFILIGYFVTLFKRIGVLQ